MMSLATSTVAARGSGFLGSARASRAVSGALAGNSLAANGSVVFALLLDDSTLMAARRGRRAQHAKRVRCPIL
jgi:hypothetical protein